MWIIYCHTNRINGKRYIGQTMQNIKKRWYDQLYGASNINSNTHDYYFSRAIRKYGKDNWDHEILEENLETLNAANEAEQWWIGHFCSNDNRFGYNQISGGGSYGKLPNDIKIKISKSLTGIKRSSETKEKDRQANLGKRKFKNKKSTSSSKYYGVRKNSKNRWRAEIVYLNNNYYLGSFLTEIEAAKTVNSKLIEIYGESAVLNLL